MVRDDALGTPPERGARLARILREIEAAVRAREPPAGMDTRIIAVDGPGGVGKSSFASHLAHALGGVSVVHTDDFASWDNPVDWWPQLIEHVLRPLARNEVARFGRGEFGHARTPTQQEIRPGGLVILEGVTASREAFRPYLTYAIWIDAPPHVRMTRGLERDGKEAREAWENWMAGEDRYKNRERPDERADLVLRGDQNLWL